MLSSGWFRLWVLLVLLTGALLAAFVTYFVAGEEACYRYVNITTSTSSEGKEEAEVIERHRVNSRSTRYCGKHQYSILVTLEHLAQAGHVSQVVFEWLEPKGWSFTDFDQLDLVEADSIRADEILSRVQSHVRASRLKAVAPAALGVVVFWLFVFSFGYGVAWVRRGFVQSRKHVSDSPPGRGEV